MTLRLFSGLFFCWPSKIMEAFGTSTLASFLKSGALPILFAQRFALTQTWFFPLEEKHLGLRKLYKMCHFLVSDNDENCLLRPQTQLSDLICIGIELYGS